MSSRHPQVDEISSDGRFRWDGREWMPMARVRREPTAWTLPMQRVAATYLALATIQSLLSTALFQNAATLERVARAGNPSLPEDQVRATVSVGLAVGWATVIVLAAAMLVLAFGSLRGWRWAFWAVLAWLALSSIGVVTNLLALANPALQPQPPPFIVIELVLSVVALGLLVWFVLAAARFGPWATRRPTSAR